MQSSESMSLVDEKIRLANKHYQNFQKYYRDRNLSKASEFLWGTLNSLFYVLGLMDGKTLSDYAKIKNYVNNLYLRHADEFIVDEFRAAEVLHANFYHGFLDREKFDYHCVKVENLIQKLWKYIEDKKAEFTV